MIRLAVVGQESPERTHCVVEKTPLFRFGVISDIQYADVDDRFSSTGKRRYYRAALPSVERAVDEWNREGVDFVVHCGDIVDGINRMHKQSDAALERVLEKLARCQMAFKHVLGNHCTCQFVRNELLKKLEFEGEGELGYYSFCPVKKWKFIVLDTCDISVYAWPPDHPHSKLAHEFLKEKNPHKDWSNPSLLSGLDRRFVSFNGAVGDVQLTWLKDVLESAKKLKQRVMIFTHIPIQPHVLPSGTLWNYDEVLKLLRSFPSVVQAVISGHVHFMSHSQDVYGIHYLSLPGVVEQPPGTEAHGIINIYNDCFTISGFEMQEFLTLTFNA